MRNSQTEIRDFIIDWDCVQSGFGLIGIEAFFIALINGALQTDLGVGILTFFGVVLLFTIPLIGGMLMLALSLVWALMAGAVMMNFTTPLISWIIGTIVFLIVITLHASVIDMETGVFCYSYLLFEAAIVSLSIYIMYESHKLAIGIFIALFICAFIPLVRHIEGFLLALLTGFTIFTAASIKLDLVSSWIFAILTFVASELIYIMMNSQFNWKEIISNKKNDKLWKEHIDEKQKRQSFLYEKYPELEKEYFYFHKCICKSTRDEMNFDKDWDDYLVCLYNANQFISFNQWYEENNLYKYSTSDYNSDYAKQYRKTKEEQLQK